MADKTVTVTITPNGGLTGTYTISVDPNPVQLDNTVATSEGIQWQIASACSYWTFTSDNQGNSTGIDIRNHRRRFRDPGGNTNPKQHKWVRQQSDGAPTFYKYTVSVTNETLEPDPLNRATLTWDPLVQNN